MPFRRAMRLGLRAFARFPARQAVAGLRRMAGLRGGAAARASDALCQGRAVKRATRAAVSGWSR